MATNFVQDGNVIDYSNSGSAISSGDLVVMGETLGVALVDIAATTGTGAVAVTGVYNFAKVSGAVIAHVRKRHDRVNTNTNILIINTMPPLITCNR